MDFQNYSVTIGSNANRSIPDVTVSMQVCASDGTVLQDFTGANAFNIWTVFGSLSAADKREVLNGLIKEIIRKKAGL